MAEFTIPNISFQQFLILGQLYFGDMYNHELAEKNRLADCSVRRSCKSLAKRSLITEKIKSRKIFYSITMRGVIELEHIHNFITHHTPLALAFTR